ncbi:MAG: Gfo/Idh/MocA family oxidoreductase [Deltaproteobacteria bacterium]|nr:Gfo/Idh/MocA family oxidoreductase [Deltaproteobacteria bacterium]
MTGRRPDRHEEPSPRFRMLVVGCGCAGRRHVRHAVATGRLAVSVASRSCGPGSLAGVERYYSALDEALRDGTWDAIVIASDTHLHLPQLSAALGRAREIFVEKPLAASSAGLAEVLARARDMRTGVSVAYQWRFHPALELTRRAVAEGRLGRIHLMQVTVGQLIEDWQPGRDYRMSYAARRAAGGGVVLTLSHELDYALWILGMPPSRMRALCGRFSSLEHDVEDAASMALECGEALVTVCLDMVRRVPRREVRVCGREAEMYWCDAERRLVLERPDGSAQVEWEDARFGREDLFAAQMRHWVAVLDGLAPSPCTGEEGRRVVEICGRALAEGMPEQGR